MPLQDSGNRSRRGFGSRYSTDQNLIRSKKFERYLIKGCYPIAIDGTQTFKRSDLWDVECLERKVRTKNKVDDDAEKTEEKKQYYVYVLEANLAFHNGMVIVYRVIRGQNQVEKRRAFEGVGV